MNDTGITPIGHFSSLGAERLQEITENTKDYTEFLKFYGRIFKHPISVALEFFAQHPDAKFIGSEAQWLKAGFHLQQSHEGIKFSDKNGSTVTLYDFTEIREDAPPPIWTVHSDNVKQIKAALQIPEETPLISGLISQSVTGTKIANCMAELNVPYSQAAQFRKAYLNMVQLMIAGRLEIGGNSFGIQPNTDALQMLPTVEQRFALLAHTAASAREALSSVEYVIQNLPTTRKTERMEEHDLRSMVQSERGRTGNSAGQRAAGGAEASAAKRHSAIESSAQGRRSGLGIDPEVSEHGGNRLVSGASFQNGDRGQVHNGDPLQVQSAERNVRAADIGHGAIVGGGADRDLRNTVDAVHGGTISGEGGVDALPASLSDSGTVGGQGSDGVSGDVGEAVRSKESPSAAVVRGNSSVGTGDAVLHRATGDGGQGTDTVHRSEIEQTMPSGQDGISVITQADIEVLRKIEPRKSILNFTAEEQAATTKWAKRFQADIGEKSPFFRAAHEWRDSEQTAIPIHRYTDRQLDYKTVSDDIKQQTIFRGIVANQDTGWEIQISRRGLEDTLTHAMRHGDTALFNALYDIESIVRHSVILDTTLSEQNNANKAYHTAFMHKMYGVMLVDEQPYLVKTTVEEFGSGRSDTLKRLYNVQDMQIEPLRHAAFTDKQLALSVLSGSSVSIAQLFEIVKACDADFYLNKRNGAQAVDTNINDVLANKEVSRIRSHNTETYKELSRLQSDCEYFIRHGCESGAIKYLHNGSADLHIARMQELYDKLPVTEKPEWLTAEGITQYAEQMHDGIRRQEQIASCYQKLQEAVLSNQTVRNAAANSDYGELIAETEQAMKEAANTIMLSDPAENAAFYNDFTNTPASTLRMDTQSAILDALQRSQTASEHETEAAPMQDTSETPIGSVTAAHRKTRSEQLYELFATEFPQIVNGEHSYERYGQLDSDTGAEPMTVEHLGSNEYGFMYYYEQNGDLMRDPDFTFTLDHASRTLHVLDYQQDGTPVGSVYQQVYSESGTLDEKMQASLESHFLSILQHIHDFERPLTKYNDAHGTVALEAERELDPIEEEEDIEETEALPEITYAKNPSDKLAANIRALRELRRLERCEQRQIPLYDKRSNDYNSKEASDARLRGYSGWGGLSQVFDESNGEYLYHRKQLHELLSPAEYEAARASSLNSHYTSQEIIDAMYSAIQQMGLARDSRILEPACGTANFITRMPHSIGNGGVVGIELDTVTAKIAQHLTSSRSDVTIMNCGFEETHLENGSFDLAIGNVPFGDYKMNDPDYVQDWLIHDAFFRKAMDKVAAGGVVAFITSSGTLDKKNSKVREYLATQADLIGAIRLPNTAFADAGTKVTADIVFLQKRTTPLQPTDPKPDWCYTAENADGLRINSYFVQNPQMILGKMQQTTHFNMLTCAPIEGVPLQKQLNDAIRHLSARIIIQKREKAVRERTSQIEPWGKDFSYHVKEDKVFYRERETMTEVKGKQQRIDMFKELCKLRDLTRTLLDRQKTQATDEALQPLRTQLNEAYDAFVAAHATLNDKTIRSAFSADADYPILSALETIDKSGKVAKADIFSQRTVMPAKIITSATTVEEALQVSLDQKGKVDIPYMATLLRGKYLHSDLATVMASVADELLDKELAYRDPEKIIVEQPYAEIIEKTEYLSGNVRRKLTMAEDAMITDPSFARNVAALQAVVPEDIKAAEIDASLGCPWIEAADYTAFLHELSGRTRYMSRNAVVSYSEVTGEFSIMNARSKADLNVNESSTYGTASLNMYEIAERLLNQRRIVVMRTEPSPVDPTKTVTRTDGKATRLAMEKAALIRAEFKKWIFATPERREKYEKIYNQLFNSLVGRNYNGSGLTFNGMAAGFTLRQHQRDCVARTIYGGNTLAAHVVGAGKSAVIAASVMKKKELGLIHKACVVVPKALTEQTARDWRKVYPDAKLLVVTAADLADERKREIFAARVATGNYDAVIMSQEQFEKMRMSADYQKSYIQQQIDHLDDLMRAHRNQRNGNARDFTTKAIEAAKKKLRVRLEKVVNPKSKQKGKDTLLDFENLGFDYLVVDEAHAYKNGFVATKMSNVSGVTTTASGRADDMQMKCDYINSTLGNGHILFCTGTPVSNSMTELYVMTRYLRPDLLTQTGTDRFDDWAATFGNITTKNKQTASGTLKLKTSFSSFKNLPELMTMYREFADIRTASQLALPRPDLKTGKAQIVTVEASPEQKAYVKELADRAYAISQGTVDPRDDNLLKITSEARLIGLGNQAIAALYAKSGRELPDGLTVEKNSKVDACVQNVARIYHEQAATNGVQIIFSDIAVNSENGNFSVYDYLKQELMAQGIPESEIVFAPKSDSKNRAEIFKAINEGKYRVVIASTGTLGTGANIQEKLYALHHLDVPWKPSDFEQREGRILRQGNSNAEVEIFNYVTQGTLDSYLYQTVTDKARFIAQLWNDKCPARVMEDCDDKVLSYGELQAAAEGNPDLRIRLELQNEINELKMLRSEYLHETSEMQKRIDQAPQQEQQLRARIEQTKTDVTASANLRDTATGKIQDLTIATNAGKGMILTERGAINVFLMQQILQRMQQPFAEMPSFQIGDFTVSVQTKPNAALVDPVFVIHGNRDTAYYCDASSAQNADNCQRLLNFFESGFSKALEATQQNLSKLQADTEQAQQRVALEFPSEARLQEAQQELVALEEKLTNGGYITETDEVVDADEEPIVGKPIPEVDDDDLAPVEDDEDAHTPNM
ncbi:MAG: helicase-related protein [Oscillospiraceae bacterium]|nr:helicase-related protein [Oscillospiraceae bacterium]